MQKTLFSETDIEFYYGSYTTCTPQWKEYHITCAFSKIYFIREGECEIVIQGEKYHGKKGDFFFIPAGTLHSFYHISDFYVTKYWIHFNLTCRQNPDILTGLPYCTNLEGCAPEICAYFSRLLQCASLGTLFAELEIRGIILLLIARYMEHSHTGNFPAATEDENNFLCLLHYIHENPQIRISIEELAERMHMHPNYFIRYFHSKLGLPPLQYMNLRRIEQSKAFLENTTLPISEIMYQAGFSDISAFSNFFKRHTGMSPQKFRHTFSKIE